MRTRAVPAENSVQFYLALRRAGVPAEMHIYRSGPHGVGLAAKVPGTSTWPDRLRDWMRVQGLLKVNVTRRETLTSGSVVPLLGGDKPSWYRAPPWRLRAAVLYFMVCP